MANFWKRPISVEILSQIHVDTTVAYLGIEFLEVGPDFLRARVPVDTRTRQPYGILHGGVSVVLAETLGSCGAAYAAPEGSGFGHQCQPPAQRPRGLGHGHGAAGARGPQHPGLAD
jgi:hypothetical protein